jgi:hypothetical protein
MELIQEKYPDLEVIQLWTYEHSGMCIETYRRDIFDSSMDAFGCTDNMEEFEKKLAKINRKL